MSRETNIRTRRAEVKAREKKKKAFMIVGIIGIVLLTTILVVAPFFEKVQIKNYEADKDTVFLLKDGTVISVTIENFEESTYDKEKLASYIEEKLAAYNLENGGDMAKKKSLKVEGDMANLVIEYASAQAYEDVEGNELFVGSMGEALKAGFTFEGTYAKVSAGKATEAAIATDFTENMDYKVAVIKANTTVSIDGEICYVSVENTEKVGKDWILIKNGAMLEMAGDSTESLDDTETEMGDEVVGDDELEVGSESTEVDFDFGDEETEEESQYSDVYTYIIYK